MLRLLAFDTATDHMSIALQANGRVWTHDGAGGAKASATLIPVVLSLLAQAELNLRDLTAIAFGRGPGAFTGLRTACSVAQGLAYGAGLPVLPIDSLCAVAEDARVSLAPQETWVTMDARMGEIYAGCFVRDPHWLMRPTGPESVGPPDHLELPVAAANFVGTGWETYKTVLSARLLETPLHCTGNCFPHAEMVALLAQPMFVAGMAIDAADVRPTYLRDNVALTIEQQKPGKFRAQGEND